MNAGPLIARLWIALSAALAFGATAAVGAEACRPMRGFPPRTTLTFDRQQFDVLPRIEGVLDHHLRIVDAPSTFGLVEPGDSVTLTRSTTLRPQRMPPDALKADSVRMRFEAGRPGVANVEYDDHRFRIRVEDGQPRSADGGPFVVDVDPLADSAPTLAAGSRVILMTGGVVRVDAGSRMTWEKGNDDKLSFVLAQGRLEEVSVNAPDAHVTIVKPVRLLPGGVMKVQVTASNFDFRSKRLVFCFAVVPRGEDGVYSYSAPAHLVSESNDGATFETNVPPQLAREVWKARQGSTNGDGAFPFDWFGKGASVLVTGLDGNRMLFQAAQPFVVTNFEIAFFSGIVLLVVLWIISGVLTRMVNPAKIMKHLAQHSTQRLSLSNLQILLWTLLVLYAFCFVWAANGILLDISLGVLVLLGISGATSVLSRTADKFDASADNRPIAAAPQWRDLVMGNDGNFDLLRFQMLGFTLFTLTYAFISVIRSEGLPDIPQNLYLLMGISNGAYLGGKIADNMSQSTTQNAAGTVSATAPSDYEKTIAATDLTAMQRGLKVPMTGAVDDVTREGVKRYKADQGITPADGTLNPMLIDRMRSDGTMAV